MASISHDGNGSRRILFFNQANERKAIRLGKRTKRDADSFKGKLESLLSAKLMGNSPDRETSLWLSELPDDLHAKLVAHELVEPRHKIAVATLGGVRGPDHRRSHGHGAGDTHPLPAGQGAADRIL